MFGCVGVLRCVTVRRTIATQGHRARLTRAQMNPLTSDFHALLTFPALRWFDRRNRFDMRASFNSHIHLYFLMAKEYHLATKRYKSVDPLNSHPSYH